MPRKSKKSKKGGKKKANGANAIETERERIIAAMVSQAKNLRDDVYYMHGADPSAVDDIVRNPCTFDFSCSIPINDVCMSGADSFHRVQFNRGVTVMTMFLYQIILKSHEVNIDSRDMLLTMEPWASSPTDQPSVWIVRLFIRLVPDFSDSNVKAYLEEHGLAAGEDLNGDAFRHHVMVLMEMLLMLSDSSYHNNMARLLQASFSASDDAASEAKATAMSLTGAGPSLLRDALDMYTKCKGASEAPVCFQYDEDNMPIVPDEVEPFNDTLVPLVQRLMQPVLCLASAHSAAGERAYASAMDVQYKPVVTAEQSDGAAPVRPGKAEAVSRGERRKRRRRKQKSNRAKKRRRVGSPPSTSSSSSAAAAAASIAEECGVGADDALYAEFVDSCANLFDSDSEPGSDSEPDSSCDSEASEAEEGEPEDEDDDDAGDASSEELEGRTGLASLHGAKAREQLGFRVSGAHTHAGALWTPYAARGKLHGASRTTASLADIAEAHAVLAALPVIMDSSWLSDCARDYADALSGSGADHVEMRNAASSVYPLLRYGTYVNALHTAGLVPITCSRDAGGVVHAAADVLAVGGESYEYGVERGPVVPFMFEDSHLVFSLDRFSLREHPLYMHALPLVRPSLATNDTRVSAVRGLTQRNIPVVFDNDDDGVVRLEVCGMDVLGHSTDIYSTIGICNRLSLTVGGRSSRRLPIEQVAIANRKVIGAVRMPGVSSVACRAWDGGQDYSSHCNAELVRASRLLSTAGTHGGALQRAETVCTVAAAACPVSCARLQTAMDETRRVRDVASISSGLSVPHFQGLDAFQRLCLSLCNVVEDDVGLIDKHGQFVGRCFAVMTALLQTGTAHMNACFTGSTTVSKTFVANLLVQLLGRERRCMVFSDMSIQAMQTDNVAYVLNAMAIFTDEMRLRSDVAVENLKAVLGGMGCTVLRARVTDAGVVSSVDGVRISMVMQMASNYSLEAMVSRAVRRQQPNDKQDHSMVRPLRARVLSVTVQPPVVRADARSVRSGSSAFPDGPEAAAYRLVSDIIARMGELEKAGAFVVGGQYASDAVVGVGLSLIPASYAAAVPERVSVMAREYTRVITLSRIICRELFDPDNAVLGWVHEGKVVINNERLLELNEVAVSSVDDAIIAMSHIYDLIIGGRGRLCTILGGAMSDVNILVNTVVEPPHRTARELYDNPDILVAADRFSGMLAGPSSWTDNVAWCRGDVSSQIPGSACANGPVTATINLLRRVCNESCVFPFAGFQRHCIRRGDRSMSGEVLPSQMPEAMLATMDNAYLPPEQYSSAKMSAAEDTSRYLRVYTFPGIAFRIKRCSASDPTVSMYTYKTGGRIARQRMDVARPGHEVVAWVPPSADNPYFLSVVVGLVNHCPGYIRGTSARATKETVQPIADELYRLLTTPLNPSQLAERNAYHRSCLMDYCPVMAAVAPDFVHDPERIRSLFHGAKAVDFDGVDAFPCDLVYLRAHMHRFIGAVRDEQLMDTDGRDLERYERANEIMEDVMRGLHTADFIVADELFHGQPGASGLVWPTVARMLGFAAQCYELVYTRWGSHTSHIREQLSTQAAIFDGKLYVSRYVLDSNETCATQLVDRLDLLTRPFRRFGGIEKPCVVFQTGTDVSRPYKMHMLTDETRREAIDAWLATIDGNSGERVAYQECLKRRRSVMLRGGYECYRSLVRELVDQRGLGTAHARLAATFELLGIVDYDVLGFCLHWYSRGRFKELAKQLSEKRGRLYRLYLQHCGDSVEDDDELPLAEPGDAIHSVLDLYRKWDAAHAAGEGRGDFVSVYDCDFGF